MTDDARRLDRSAWGLVDEAAAEIETIRVEQAERELEAGEALFVDIRDVRELWIEGTIPGSEHAPRGMLEFWADPDTEYYRDYFDPERRTVLFCNEAGRSALAAKRLREMGFEDVAHLEGGFTAWQEAGGEIEDVPQKDYKNR